MNKKENHSAKSEIEQALLRLMTQKSYMDITVTDIVQEAKVARVSFYRNFASISEVLDSIADATAEKLNIEFLPMLEKMGIHLSKTTFLGGVQLVVEQVRKEGAMTLAPHCAAQHYHDAYGLVRLDMDEDPIWAWENIVYKNYETLKPAARALARSSAVYADELVKKDTSGWIIRPNGTA